MWIQVISLNKDPGITLVESVATMGNIPTYTVSPESDDRWEEDYSVLWGTRSSAGKLE